MTTPEPDTPTQRWKVIALTIGALVLIAIVVLDWNRIGADFWPPDRSFVGPNLVAAVVQAIIVGVFIVLIWPPARRRIHRFLDRKLDGIHNKLDKAAHEMGQHRQHVHEHNEWMARHTAELFEKQTGRPADQHPHFDGVGGRPAKFDGRSER